MTTYKLRESNSDWINKRFCKKEITTYFLKENNGDSISTPRGSVRKRDDHAQAKEKANIVTASS